MKKVNTAEMRVVNAGGMVFLYCKQCGEAEPIYKKFYWTGNTRFHINSYNSALSGANKAYDNHKKNKNHWNMRFVIT